MGPQKLQNREEVFRQNPSRIWAPEFVSVGREPRLAWFRKNCHFGASFLVL